MDMLPVSSSVQSHDTTKGNLAKEEPGLARRLILNGHSWSIIWLSAAVSYSSFGRRLAVDYHLVLVVVVLDLTTVISCKAASRHRQRDKLDGVPK